MGRGANIKQSPRGQWRFGVEPGGFGVESGGGGVDHGYYFAPRMWRRIFVHHRRLLVSVFGGESKRSRCELELVKRC